MYVYNVLCIYSGYEKTCLTRISVCQEKHIQGIQAEHFQYPLFHVYPALNVNIYIYKWRESQWFNFSSQSLGCIIHIIISFSFYINIADESNYKQMKWYEIMQFKVEIKYNT